MTTEVGDGPIHPGPATMPILCRRIGRVDMVAYAGATWDWHRLHHDPDYLAERGLPAPVVDGQVFGALIVETVQDGLGPHWRMAALSFRLSRLVFAGEMVRCAGRVLEAAPDRVVCAVDVDSVDDVGGPVKRVITAARAELVRRR